ncbi:MAG: hypothetical protein JKY08_10370 [Flavobacteriaceae bacterium]|nr:hypothetical protein [Flavobacteriaceae bacterium]
MKEKISIQNSKPLSEEKKSKKLRFYGDRKIKNQATYLHRTYGVSIGFTDGKNIDYLLEVKSIKKENENYSYRLTRKRFFKNGEQLHSFMDTLAEKSVDCLYPLDLKVAQNGEVIDVENQSDIEKRWKESRKKIAKTYHGEIVESYFNTMDTAVSTKENLYKCLANDMIYSLLFSNIYIAYTKEFQVEMLKEIPFMANYKSLVFNGMQQIDRYVNTNNRFSIYYKGDLQPTNQLEKGHLDICYQLDAEDYGLLRIDGKATVTFGHYEKTIDFKIIAQKNLDKTKENTIKAHKALGIYDDPNEPEPKWYQLWKYL